MLDILISFTHQSETALYNCLSSIPNIPEVTTKVITLAENPTLEDTPGSTYNNILQYCTNPIFTILNADDFYNPNAIQTLLEFIQYKSFGLVHAASTHRRTNTINPYSCLPITSENILSVNPIRKPIFYNRKVVNWWQYFDTSLQSVEYDMSLKIWERFPIHYLPTPLLNTKSNNPPDNNDIFLIQYNAAIRHTKQYYYAYPNMYNDDLIKPISSPNQPTSSVSPLRN